MKTSKCPTVENLFFFVCVLLVCHKILQTTDALTCLMIIINKVFQRKILDC